MTTQHTLRSDLLLSAARAKAELATALVSTTSKINRAHRVSALADSELFMAALADSTDAFASDAELAHAVADLQAATAALAASVAADDAEEDIDEEARHAQLVAELADARAELEALSQRLAALEAADDPPPPPAPTRTTKIGASTMRSGTTNGWDSLEAACGGPLQARRVFLGPLQGKVFPTWANDVTRFGLTRVAHAYVTFKDDPAVINSGSRDAALRTYCADAKTWATANNKTVCLDFFHEPEDNVERGEFTMAAWQAAANRVISIAASAGILGGFCLMGWTWGNGDLNGPRDHAAWLNPIDKRAVVLLDPYNLGEADNASEFRTPKQLFDPIRGDVLGRGFTKWAVVETGCATGLLSQAVSDKWITDMCAYAQTSDALSICYFDGTGNLAGSTLTPSMATILGAAARS